MAGAAAFAVDPVEAIEFLRRKLNVPTARWTDIWQGMHSAAFVVAGAEGDALLADFHEAVNRTIAEGRTLEQFREDFDRIVAEHGWSYRGSRNWRSRVIFQTNLRTAYAAGRWAQIQRLKKRRPYLRYVAVMDDRTRPLHARWHNTTLHCDDPWWETHFPPNGWNCRCSIQQLSERDLKRYGYKVSDVAPPIDLIEREINTASGKISIMVPKGIDPGFAYNPGKAGFGLGAESLALEKHGAWEPLEAPGSRQQLAPLPVDRPAAPPIGGVAPGDEAALRRALRTALGAEEVVLVDPKGGRVRLGQAIVDHMLAEPSRQDGRERYFGLMPGLIEDPAEIWVGWSRHKTSGRVALRRRYIKLVDIGGGRVIGIVADADGGEWSGMTFFRGNARMGARLRAGRLIYRRS